MPALVYLVELPEVGQVGLAAVSRPALLLLLAPVPHRTEGGGAWELLVHLNTTGMLALSAAVE